MNLAYPDQNDGDPTVRDVNSLARGNLNESLDT